MTLEGLLSESCLLSDHQLFLPKPQQSRPGSNPPLGLYSRLCVPPAPVWADYQTTKEDPPPWSLKLFNQLVLGTCSPCLTGSFPWKP